MPAILTTQPQIFNPDGDASLSPDNPLFGPHIGPDGAWSEVIAEPGQTGYHVIERTSSGGPPWLSQDDASSNRPPNAVGGIQNGGVVATPTHIHVANYDSSDNYFRSYPFDRSTKTWGTPGVSPDTQASTYIWNFIGCLSDGSLIVLSFFNDFPFSLNLYYHKISSSGVWGTRQLLTTDVGHNDLRASLDSSDRLHIFHVENDLTPPGPAKVHYLQFDAVGETITIADSVIYTAPANGNINPDGTSGVLVDEGNDKLYWFFTPNGYGSNSDHIPRLIIGDGLAAPSFSVESADPTLISISDTSTQAAIMTVCLVFDANGDIMPVWCVAYGVGPDDIYTNVEAWTNSRANGGSFGTPALLYDAVANPGPDFSYPVDFSYYEHIHYVNVLKPSVSNWLFQFGYQMGGSPYTNKTYIIEPLITIRNYASAGGALAGPGSYASA